MNSAVSQPLLSLQNVGASYWRRKGYFSKEKFWALKDITFDLHPGEALGVIGRNGAGKSTLLRLLAGIVKPNRGVLVSNGCTATLLSLQLGFQPELSGQDNAILSGMLLGLRKAEVEAKLSKIKSFSELDDFFEQPLKTYSSGMRARLGFSVAFQLDPDVLLIDEVLAVGDAEFRKKSAKVMREKIKSNKAIVLVSHSLETIRQLCNRAIWIEHGEIKAYGETEDIIQWYGENN